MNIYHINYKSRIDIKKEKLINLLYLDALVWHLDKENWHCTS